MKTPLETLWGTVISGVILTIILAVIIAFTGTVGLWIDLVIVIVIWLGMFGLLQKPS